jgi:hypothetical protein
MKKSFSKLFLVPVTVLVMASFAVAPAEAARGGGGGGGGGGRAAGGGGGGQVNNAGRDARANDVRSTSVNNVNVKNTNVNNVNVNKNTNVNVNVNHNNGWDNDYHPVATAVVVTAAVVAVGSMVRTVPPGCVPVNYRGMIYQQCGSTWYQPQGSQYVVIVAPY